MRTELRVPEIHEPLSHYTDAVVFGDLCFVSGCAPLDKEGNLVGEGDVEEQTRQVLRNLQSILNTANLHFGNILKVTVFLTDVEDRKAVNGPRKEFFGEFRPASTLLEVSALALPRMKVEIEAVAGYA